MCTIRRLLSDGMSVRVCLARPTLERLAERQVERCGEETQRGGERALHKVRFAKLMSCIHWRNCALFVSFDEFGLGINGVNVSLQSRLQQVRLELPEKEPSFRPIPLRARNFGIFGSL